MNTLLLDRNLWDLVRDASGNIALAAKPYATAQDVASAVKTFKGEVYYDTTRGIPYFTQVFDGDLPVQIAKEQIAAAALTVPDVATAQVYVGGLDNRALSGQVIVTDVNGTTTTVGLS